MGEPRKKLQLPVKLTEDELLAKASELASARANWEALKEESKESAAGYRERIADLDDDISKLSTEVRTKEELRDVEIDERPDFARNVIETFRVDTFKLVSTRVMTADERQVRMFEAGPSIVEESEESTAG